MNLQELARSLELDVEVVEKLAATFVAETQKDLWELEQALATGDGPLVARAAHHVKGAAAALELETIRAEAAALEAQGREGRLEGAAPRVSRLRDSLAALSAALRRP